MAFRVPPKLASEVLMENYRVIDIARDSISNYSVHALGSGQSIGGGSTARRRMILLYYTLVVLVVLYHLGIKIQISGSRA